MNLWASSPAGSMRPRPRLVSERRRFACIAAAGRAEQHPPDAVEPTRWHYDHSQAQPAGGVGRTANGEALLDGVVGAVVRRLPVAVRAGGDNSGFVARRPEAGAHLGAAAGDRANQGPLRALHHEAVSEEVRGGVDGGDSLVHALSADLPGRRGGRHVVAAQRIPPVRVRERTHMAVDLAAAVTTRTHHLRSHRPLGGVEVLQDPLPLRIAHSDTWQCATPRGRSRSPRSSVALRSRARQSDSGREAGTLAETAECRAGLPSGLVTIWRARPRRSARWRAGRQRARWCSRPHSVRSRAGEPDAARASGSATDPNCSPPGTAGAGANRYARRTGRSPQQVMVPLVRSPHECQ